MISAKKGAHTAAKFKAMCFTPQVVQHNVRHK